MALGVRLKFQIKCKERLAIGYAFYVISKEFAMFWLYDPAKVTMLSHFRRNTYRENLTAV